MQPNGTVWTTLVGDHPGIIPVTFGKNPMSGLRGEVILMKENEHMHTQATENIVSQKLTLSLRDRCKYVNKYVTIFCKKRHFFKKEHI